MCAVNAHMHWGAEHRSAGQYDENGRGPRKPVRPVRDGGSDEPDDGRRMPLSSLGGQCYHYDKNDKKFTKEYDVSSNNSCRVDWQLGCLGAVDLYMCV